MEHTLAGYHDNASIESSLAPFQVQEGWTFVPRAGVRQVIAVPLVRGLEVAGRVREPDGALIERAKLTFYSEWRGDRRSGGTAFFASTNAAGEFEASGIAVSVTRLTVEAAGFEPLALRHAALDALLAQSDAIDLTLSR